MRLRRIRASLSMATVVVALSALVAAPVAGANDGLSVPASVVADVAVEKSVQTYVVVLDDTPVAAYDGDVAGYAATRGEAPESVQVRRYERYLQRQADAALRNAGIRGAKKGAEFTTALNGFSVELTGAQAARLRAQPDVLTVAPNEIRQLTTDSTPDFLGLTDTDGGLWADAELLGEDVVIGVIDSGIRPESESFADRAAGTEYDPPTDWSGACEAGDGSFEALGGCNDKLIGARWYLDGFGGEAALADFPEEFLSPLDADGHGTHTASTAGGNADVTTPFGDISGIAPRARIAAYKVCWGYSGGGGCSTLDSVNAIDDAVADGVDVINYSISGTADNFLDPVEVAFLFAADAGVVVNASAGNAGPGLSTANHPSPWILTVGAGTETEQFSGTVTIDDAPEGEEDTTYGGAPSIASPGIGMTSLVFAGDVAADGVAVGDAALCLTGTLDPDLVAGRMVLCERGAVARVAKSDEVAAAGGVAMILGNTSENSLNSDAHVIPTLHVAEDVTADITAYITAAGADAQASLSPADTVEAPAPDVAAFSARGPLAGGDILVPDIFAPGVDVLAAYSPTIGGRSFDYLSGTSMSSPHMAGMSALLKQAHPLWSASAIRSAFMTTASQTRTDGSPIAGGPFAYGSGHASPNDALAPGLVYDAGYFDWVGFICGTGQLTGCGDLTIDPSDLNQPNIAIGALAGSQTVTRTVTNVGDEAATYSAAVAAPDGVEVTVSPSTFTIEPEGEQTFTVEFVVTDAATLGEATFGELTWSDGTTDVTSQLVVTPVQLAAPSQVNLAGRDASGSYDVDFGYSGAFTAAAHGLELPTVRTRWVQDDPANDINTALGTGVGVNFETITVPEGAALARFALFDDETLGDDDLDLYVFGPSGFVGGSGSPTSAERVDVLFPEPGTYTVVVHGWQTHKQGTTYSLFGWSVLADPGADDGSLRIEAPDEAVLGEPGTIELDWGKVKNGRRYLGAVSYADDAGLIGLTVVAIDS